MGRSNGVGGSVRKSKTYRVDNPMRKNPQVESEQGVRSFYKIRYGNAH